MSLLFQHPALLGLLALAGLPVLVHLLSRARPPVYRFSNIEFLRRVLRNTARFRRPGREAADEVEQAVDMYHIVDRGMALQPVHQRRRRQAQQARW